VSIQDVAGITVIASFTGAILLWLSGRYFATRKDIHNINNRLTRIELKFNVAQNDMSWIKAKLSGEEVPN